MNISTPHRMPQGKQCGVIGSIKVEAMKVEVIN